jgi:nicotinamidase/pyrazinamidase
VRDTPGAEFVSGLEIEEDADVIRKGVGGEDGYSAFSVRDPVSGVVSGTSLDDLLERRRVLRLVIAGLATDYCVKETVLDARRLGYETTVITEGIRAVGLQPGDGERALEAIRAAGATLV